MSKLNGVRSCIFIRKVDMCECNGTLSSIQCKVLIVDAKVQSELVSQGNTNTGVDVNSGK